MKQTINENVLLEFKNACYKYLMKYSMFSLRQYGRFLGLKNLSEKNREELLDNLVGIVCGEILPDQTLKGKPVKNKNLGEETILPIIKTISELKQEYRLEEI